MPSIQKLAFHLLHVHILVTHYCGNTFREAFTRCSAYQDVLCRIYYVERVVASFAHQIKYEYYGGNRSVSIEVISLEKFIKTDQGTLSSSLHSRTFNSMFHSFMYDNIKQDADTTDVNRKLIIELLKDSFFKSHYYMVEYR